MRQLLAVSTSVLLAVVALGAIHRKVETPPGQGQNQLTIPPLLLWNYLLQRAVRVARPLMLCS